MDTRGLPAELSRATSRPILDENEVIVIWIVVNYRPWYFKLRDRRPGGHARVAEEHGGPVQSRIPLWEVELFLIAIDLLFLYRSVVLQ